MANALVVFPDAVEVALDYLRAEAAHYPAIAAVQFVDELPPKVVPGRTVRVRRVGGVPRGLVTDVARLDLIVWDANPHAAQATAAMLRALMLAAPLKAVVVVGTTRVPVHGCTEVLGPTLGPDPIDPDREVVLLTYELALRGDAQPLA